ncbi:MAG: succinate dehydrogenase iron-sulfur subunit [Candidatus Krumholzibacteriota bacterium]|nr:succinate dehydrogenase iron-sulfur subunit [Candidatus Krumholzibacteriota bacterium]
MSTQSQNHQVVFHVRRYDPDHDAAPAWKDYRVPVPPGMTVLDGLHYIKEHFDGTLAWRFSCRMGVCGSCAMLINGMARLACNTQILDVSRTALTIAPLPNYEIIKDLVPDLAPMFAHHASMKPWLIREDRDEILNPTGEYKQTREELEQYIQFTNCIKCGACLAACPTVATDPTYPGPMALAQAYRFCVDSRDGGLEERRDALDTPHGLYRCHYAGECSRVCPKGVDPARAIQLMKRNLVFSYLKLVRRREPSQLLTGPVPGAERRSEIPAPPPFTVEGAGDEA